MPEVEELSNNLSAFLFELPDPTEELFYQAPDTFWLFSKLPLEIRQNIWRQTFPRRTHMMLNSPYRCLRLMQKHAPPPPVSSQVNFESRQETLLHYKVFQLSTWCKCYSRRPETFYFHPKRDSIRVHDSYLNMRPDIRKARGYKKCHFGAALKEFTCSVRSLELIWQYVEQEDGGEGLSEECVLGNFEGLQALKLLDLGHGPRGQLMINAYTRFFQLRAASKPGCAIPKVSIQKY
jgi:hypothetical protein